jgi:hypothetical protein
MEGVWDAGRPLPCPQTPERGSPNKAHWEEVTLRPTLVGLPTTESAGGTAAQRADAAPVITAREKPG